MHDPEPHPRRPAEKTAAPAAAPPPGRLVRLRARFDSGLLTAPTSAGLLPPPAPPPACSGAAALQQALATLSAGPAGYADAGHLLAPDAAQRARQRAWLNHQLLLLDGTWHMQSLGGPWRQRMHRLATKLRELAAAGAVPGGPWDCGFVNGGADAAALAARAAAFTPRRPTLMVAWQLPSAALQPLRQALQARHGSYHLQYQLPVRLWVLHGPTQV